MTVGDRVKQLREAKKMSQDELAHAVGYKSRSTVGKIELGKMDLTQSSIVAIAKALGTTPGYLMGWEDENGIPNKENETAEFIKLFSQLPKDKQLLVVNIIKGFLEEK